MLQELRAQLKVTTAPRATYKPVHSYQSTSRYGTASMLLYFYLYTIVDKHVGIIQLRDAALFANGSLIQWCAGLISRYERRTCEKDGFGGILYVYLQHTYVTGADIYTAGKRLFLDTLSRLELSYSIISSSSPYIYLYVWLFRYKCDATVSIVNTVDY